MPSYAPNYTPRLKAKYTVNGLEHTIQVRRTRGSTISQVTDMRGALQLLFQNWATLLSSDFGWISCEYALEDSDIFVPIANPAAVTGTIDPTTYTPMQKATGTTQSGRAAGSKSRFTLFGIWWNFTDQAGADQDAFNGIVTAAENAAVGANKILADGTPFCAGSGGPATWYNQCTVKPNDLLWKLVRRGAIT